MSRSDNDPLSRILYECMSDKSMEQKLVRIEKVAIGALQKGGRAWRKRLWDVASRDGASEGGRS